MGTSAQVLQEKAKGVISFRSFRDPDGQVFTADGRILRAVYPGREGKVRAALSSSAVAEFQRSGRMVGSRFVDLGVPAHVPEPAMLLEHDRIEFPSYPYEWPPEMLHAAATLTLDFAEALFRENLGLKDATPYNVLFNGPDPVFVDVLSIEEREPGDAVWLAEAQFERTFVLPLIAMREFRLSPASIFLSRRDGLEPHDLLNLCSALQCVRPSLLLPVTLPAILTRRRIRTADYHRRLLDSSERAEFVFRAMLKRLRRQVRRWQPDVRGSQWTEYTETATGGELKQDFLSAELRRLAPRRVLDVGCNTGIYSLLAAQTGASVVAIDTDVDVVGRTWRAAVRDRARILPLVVDITRPTPGVGWKNAECPGFLERGRAAFDLVMMLAVIHHMAITERIPLPEIAILAWELTSAWLIAEWVGPADPMAILLARGRDDLNNALTRDQFEAAFSARFEVLRSIPTGSDRMVYVMHRKS